VAEVGRDHDYDWAIVEPSSMRSVIQLAGRVLRHRAHVPQCPNVGLLNQNYRSLINKPICFKRPGFEYENNGPRMKKEKQKLDEILEAQSYESIDASPRIIKPVYNAKATEFDNLVHLEHRALCYSLFEKLNDKPKAANVWWKSSPHWCGEVQRQQRFRASPSDEAYYLIVENKYRPIKWLWRNESISPPKFGEGDVKIVDGSDRMCEFGMGSHFWFSLCAKEIYMRLAEEIKDADSDDLSQFSKRYGEVRLIDYQNGSVQEYEYHPELGVYKAIGEWE